MRKQKSPRRRRPAGRGPSIRLTAKSFALRYLEALDTPRSLAAYMLLKYGELDQLVELKCNPLEYLDCDPLKFAVDYQAVKLMSKFPHFELKQNPLENAMVSFIEAEKQCRDTNVTWMDRSKVEEFKDPAVNSVLFRAARKISTILGDVPSLDELPCAFGPGATVRVRKETSAYNKVISVPECTFAMHPILGQLSRAFPSWLDGQEYDFVEGSVLMFVLKNATTHRAICAEPLVNGFAQKGYGSYMRRRLRKFGVNLDDQSVNQKLAALAFRHGLATVDFRSASDTIAYLVVMNLLPEPWFRALDLVRSPSFSYEDSWYNFEKFSSMGNACTFELETLLFYSLACACCEELGIRYETGANLSVYGDDVIIPTEAFSLFQRVCGLCGFSINSEKSFTEGCFFESCGTDYFCGHPVRPFLLKKEVTSLEVAYYAANNVLQSVQRFEALPSVSDRSARLRLLCESLHHVHSWVVSCIPRNRRYLVPLGSGDGGLVADFSLACPRPARSLYNGAGWEGWIYKSVRSLAVKHAYGDDVPMSLATYYAYIAKQVQAVPLPVLFKHGLVQSDGWKDIQRATDNGAGYTVRKRTKTRTIQQVWFDPWPSAPPWSERSIALIHETPSDPKRRYWRKRGASPPLQLEESRH